MHPTPPLLPMRHVTTAPSNRVSARDGWWWHGSLHRPSTTAGRFAVPHHFLAIGQPQIRYSDPNPPARPSSLWFTQCFEVANRVHYPRGPLRLRAGYLGGASRTAQASQRTSLSPGESCIGGSTARVVAVVLGFSNIASKAATWTQKSNSAEFLVSACLPLPPPAGSVPTCKARSFHIPACDSQK